MLANLDATAKAEKWDALLPKVVADVMKYKGNYVAAPVNVHRVNWMWANAEVLKKAGVPGAPKTWDEFFAAADKVKKAGLIAVAHGGQNWQDFTTFEDVVLGVGGAKFYEDALVKLDQKALTSPTMTKALETFRKIKGYTDTNAPGRDWNLATAMVIDGRAAFQFMGDWAKGEFTAAKKMPGKDYVCAAAPGTGKAYTFNVDSFAMFKLKDAGSAKGAGRPGRVHHGHAVPGSLQPEQGLDPGAPEHGHGQVRRLRQDVGQGLRRHRQDRRPGAVDRARHGGQPGGRRCDQGCGQPVLERRQDLGRRRREEHRQGRGHQVVTVERHVLAP